MLLILQFLPFAPDLADFPYAPDLAASASDLAASPYAPGEISSDLYRASVRDINFFLFFQGIF